jgi:hypothetical protein
VKKLWWFSLFAVAGCSPYFAPPVGIDHPASAHAPETPSPPPSTAFADPPPPGAQSEPPGAGHEDAELTHGTHGGHGPHGGH